MTQANYSARAHALLEEARTGSLDIEFWLDAYDRSESLKERALGHLFRDLYPGNDDEEQVLMKVSCLNALFNAGLYNNPGKQEAPMPDLVAMTERIVSNRSLDRLIASASGGERIEAVEFICSGGPEDAGRYRRAYSFATKYCSFHMPSLFPIADARTMAMLSVIAPELGFEDEPDCGDYGTFCRLHAKLSARLVEWCGRKLDAKQLDMFLWQYAGEL